MQIRALNLSAGLVLLSDGSVTPVEQMIDGWGEETDDPAQAVTFVFLIGRKWHACQVRGVPRVTIH